MTGVTYGPVLAPVATDSADGVAAFNNLSGQIEANFDLTNQWATNTATQLLGTNPVGASGVCTPISPWVFLPASGLVRYGCTWGAYKFVCFVLVYNGPPLLADAHGRLTPSSPMFSLKPRFNSLAQPGGWLRNVPRFTVIMNYKVPVSCVRSSTTGNYELTGLNQGNATVATGANFVVQGIYI